MMRSVFSLCASDGTAVIFTCLFSWGFAISWFSICITLPLLPTNTIVPLLVVQLESQVLRLFTLVTHFASQMLPVIFVCLSAAHSNAAEHRIPTNNHAIRFIHASCREFYSYTFPHPWLENWGWKLRCWWSPLPLVRNGESSARQELQP